MTYWRFEIVGRVAGFIWMPSAICWKDVHERSDQYPYTAYTHGGESVDPTLRDMALHVTNDGDFQSCGLTPDSCVVVERVTRTETGTVTRRRLFDVGFFPSISDCVVKNEEVLEEVA